MNTKEFEALYLRLIGQYQLSPETAQQILDRILEILKKEGYSTQPKFDMEEQQKHD